MPLPVASGWCADRRPRWRKLQPQSAGPCDRAAGTYAGARSDRTSSGAAIVGARAARCGSTRARSAPRRRASPWEVRGRALPLRATCAGARGSEPRSETPIMG
eukprot:scaffold105776_cov32-Tisochrysis_lutea.AAC.2